MADGNAPRFSQGRDVRTVASAEGPAQAARSHSGAPSPEGQWWGLAAEWTWGRTRGGAEDDRRIRCGAQRGLQSQSAQRGSDVTLHVGCSACQRASRLMRPPGGWRAAPCVTAVGPRAAHEGAAQQRRRVKRRGGRGHDAGVVTEPGRGLCGDRPEPSGGRAVPGWHGATAPKPERGQQGTVLSPPPAVSLFVVSVIHGQPLSENTKWKVS